MPCAGHMPSEATSSAPDEVCPIVTWRTTMRGPEDGSVRKRKRHTKSRQGCNNCKLRKVKCDESKPKCEKCSSYGVCCDYGTQSMELSFSGAGSFQTEMANPGKDAASTAFNADELIDSMMNAPLYLHAEEGVATSDVCYLEKVHLDLLRKFHNRSALTLGTTDSIHVYRRILAEMACRHSFVLHAVLRFTLLHDRYLYEPLGATPSAAEAVHGYHAAALFSKMLSMESHSSEIKDALWGTSALLGASTFADIEATCAEKAWPLKLSSTSDLDWLKMSEGKSTVWRLADPSREDSQFRDIVEHEQRKQRTGPMEPADPALGPFLIYCTSLAQEGDIGPYHKAASIMERLARMKCTHHSALWFLSFLSHADPAYMQAVVNRHAPALVLLAVWYAKLLEYNVWWVSRRCLYECQAICIFLSRVLPQEDPMLRLLEFPRSVCGLVGQWAVDKDAL